MNTIATGAALIGGTILGAAVVRPIAVAYARPRPDPASTTCPGCGQVVLGFRVRAAVHLLRARCPGCAERLGPAPGVAEGLTGVAVAGVVAGQAAGWLLAAQLWFALVGSVLVLTDAKVRRLPHDLTGAACIGLAALLIGATIAGQPVSVAVRALAGAAAVWGLFFLTVLTKTTFWGDFRLSPALGGLLAWTGWSTVGAGLAVSIFLAPLLACAGLIAQRAPWRRWWPALAPAMLAVSAAAGVAVWRAFGLASLGALTAWAVLLLQEVVVLAILPGRTRKTKVPLGPALVVGTLLASVAFS
ncbi:hypothetical protein [Kitasatospora sp. NPDC086791]|uniref:hypothetical protein n=1 Tax=Kitasatospora sp. NPDC086791 TaxID=3155178 RepID=UPI00343F4C7F